MKIIKFHLFESLRMRAIIYGYSCIKITHLPKEEAIETVQTSSSF